MLRGDNLQEVLGFFSICFGIQVIKHGHSITKSGPLSQTEHLLQALNKKNKSNIYMPLFCYAYDLSVIPQMFAISININ